MANAHSPIISVVSKFFHAFSLGVVPDIDTEVLGEHRPKP